MAVFMSSFLLLPIYLEGNQSYPQVVYIGSNPKVYQIFSIANVIWSSQFLSILVMQLLGTYTSVECEKKRLTMCHCSLSHYTLICQFRMMSGELEKYITILARRNVEYEERSEGLKYSNQTSLVSRSCLNDHKWTMQSVNLS